MSFLAARATPGVELVENSCYRRSISTNGHHGYFEISLDEANHALVARVQFGDPRSLFFITERIRFMLDLNADWAAIADTLKADPILAARMKAQPGLRVPGCWNGFELAVRAILGQQVSVKGATTLAGRLVKTFGEKFIGATDLTHVFPEPSALADANFAGIGLPKARSETIRSLARAVCAGRIRFDGVTDSGEFLAPVRNPRHRRVDRTIRCHARSGRARRVSLNRPRTDARNASRQRARIGAACGDLAALALIRRHSSLECRKCSAS